MNFNHYSSSIKEMEDSVNETTVLQTILLANICYSRFLAFLDDDAVEGFLRGVEEDRDVDFFAAGLDFLAAADDADFLTTFFSSTGSSASTATNDNSVLLRTSTSPLAFER